MTDKRKIILTDIDGVEPNWEYAFGEYMEFPRAPTCRRT